jgi:nicotinamide mononucleotide transporter
MEQYFSIQNIAFEAFGYPMSYLEVWGTLFGLFAVILAAREHILSWPIGLINVVLLFFLFYQHSLYSDMFLQIFFFASNILGWYFWLNPKTGEENQNNQLKITTFNAKNRIIIGFLIFFGTICLSWVIINLNVWLPKYFPNPAAFPYADTFVMTTSIVAQIAMTKKKLDSWMLWILVDLVATVIYLQKNMLLMSIEYSIFCGIASLGFWGWYKSMKMNEQKSISRP